MVVSWSHYRKSRPGILHQVKKCLPNVMLGNVASLLFSWRNWFGNMVWIFGIWCKLVWCGWPLVWNEQNRRSFEDMESSLDQLKTMFARTLFDWSPGLGASLWHPKSNHKKYDLSCLHMINLYEVKISKKLNFTSKEKENSCNKISLLRA